MPLGGALFVLEGLLGTFAWRALVPAVATSAIAALVARIGLGDAQQYHVAPIAAGAPLFAWSAVCGPLFGVAAHGFVRLTAHARARAPKDGRLPALALVNFAIVGALATVFPQLLGNGKGPAALGFDGQLAIGLAATLLVLKIAITWSSLRAGAEGGLLTPGLAHGALLAIVLGGLWRAAWPGEPLGAFAVVGASAFLAASMRMPLTAIVLVVEFTRVGHDVLIPMLIAVVGAVAVFRLLERRRERKTEPAA